MITLTLTPFIELIDCEFEMSILVNKYLLTILAVITTLFDYPEYSLKKILAYPSKVWLKVWF